MAAQPEVPPLLARQEFYRRMIPAVVEQFPGYELSIGEVFLSLAMAYDTIASHFGRRFGRYGLSLPSFNLLMVVNSPSYRATGCPMSQIGELLLVSKANVTGLVDSLERKALVKRTDADYDRRVKLVRITPKGAALLAKLLPGHLTEVHRVMSGLGRADRLSLRDLLRKLQAVVDRALEAGDAKTAK